MIKLLVTAFVIAAILVNHEARTNQGASYQGNYGIGLVSEQHTGMGSKVCRYRDELVTTVGRYDDCERSNDRSN